MRLQALFAASLLSVMGCGDGASSAPTSSGDITPVAATGFPAGTTIELVSGESGDGVAGGTFIAFSRELVSDAAGRIVLDASIPSGASLEIRASGFLTRETILRSANETRFELWPSAGPSGIDESYTRRLVYTSASVGEEMMEALERPALDTPFVAVIPADAIVADPVAIANLRAAVDEMTDALEGSFTYQVGARAGAVQVELLVEPGNESIVEDNLRAFTRCWMNRLEIFRCEIVFRSVEIARSETVLHELGHTFGLNHSPFRNEIMAVRRTAAPEKLSTRERLVMTMMRKRRAGNLFPDNDRQAPSLRVDAAVSQVVCRHPS